MEAIALEVEDSVYSIEKVTLLCTRTALSILMVKRETEKIYYSTSYQDRKQIVANKPNFRMLLDDIFEEVMI